MLSQGQIKAYWEDYHEIPIVIKIVDLIIDELGTEKSNEIQKDISAALIDIDLSNELSQVLLLVFTCLKLEDSDPQKFAKYLAYTVTVSGKKVGIQDVVNKIKKLQIKVNISNAAPIVHIMTLFGSFLKEVTANLNVNISKKPQKRNFMGDFTETHNTPQKLSQYCYINRYKPLLQGITLAPKRRAEVFIHLGPMSQAILMMTEDNQDIERNLASALTASLRMLPRSDDIVNSLIKIKSRETHHINSTTVSTLLKELGEILLLTCNTHYSQKIHLPLLLIMHLWQNKKEVEWKFLAPGVKKLYTEAVHKELKFKMRSGAEAQKTAEAVFHACFGTYLGDLSLLSQITTHTLQWHPVRDLRAVFVKRSDIPIIFKPIGFSYVSEMKYGEMWSTFSPHEYPHCMSVFEGFRRRLIPGYWQSCHLSKNGINVNTEDPSQLLSAFRKLKTIISERNYLGETIMDPLTLKWEKFENKVWSKTEADFLPVFY